MSVVKDYYRLQKFNVMEIADGKNEDENSKMGEGRFTRREQTVMVDAGETPAEKSEA